MKRSADKRIQMTKRLLAQELVRSASQRDLKEISVRELCENAGVSRVTFYKYYKSIDELLAETARNAMADVSPKGRTADQKEKFAAGKLTQDKIEALEQRKFALEYINDFNP